MDGGAAETGIGQPVRRREDLRLLTGRGPLQRRPQSAGPGLCGDGALAARACADPRRSTRRRRCARAGRARGADRPTICCADGLKPMPHAVSTGIRPTSARATRTARRRSSAPHYPDGRRRGAPCRRDRRHGGRDSARRGEGRRRTGRGRLRAACRRSTHARAAASRDAPRARRTQLECLPRRRGRRRAPRPTRRSPRAAHVVRFETWVQRIAGVPMEPRAAIGEYDAATGRYTLHAGAGGAVRPRHDLAVGARRRRRRGARGDARCRRQFRHARRDLQSGIRAGGLGGAARRPPGQMDLRPQRGVPQRLPGARSGGRGRTRARRARATSSRCAAPTSAIIGAYAATLRLAAARASRSCRASTTCRPCISAPAPR